MARSDVPFSIEDISEYVDCMLLPEQINELAWENKEFWDYLKGINDAIAMGNHDKAFELQGAFNAKYDTGAMDQSWATNIEQIRQIQNDVFIAVFNLREKKDRLDTKYPNLQSIINEIIWIPDDYSEFMFIGDDWKDIRKSSR